MIPCNTRPKDTNNERMVDKQHTDYHTAVRVLATLHISSVLKLYLLQANSTGHVIWAIAAFAFETGMQIGRFGRPCRASQGL